MKVFITISILAGLFGCSGMATYNDPKDPPTFVTEVPPIVPPHLSSIDPESVDLGELPDMAVDLGISCHNKCGHKEIDNE